ncbi:MAG: hypothetical protein ABIF84_00735 [Patescibacteria group bacterium]
MFKNSLRKFYPLIILSLVILSVIFFVFQIEAADVVREQGSISNPLGSTDFTQLLIRIINWIARIIGAVAILMIMYGGVLYMVSGGEENKITSAKKTIYWALGGLAIALAAESLIWALYQILGVK